MPILVHPAIHPTHHRDINFIEAGQLMIDKTPYSSLLRPVLDKRKLEFQFLLEEQDDGF